MWLKNDNCYQWLKKVTLFVTRYTLLISSNANVIKKKKFLN